MKEIVDVLNTARQSKTERLKAQRAFLKKREEVWKSILEGRFPESYQSSATRSLWAPPRRTAIRCDFLLASKIALGPKYMKDKISDLAQRDLLFSVLRDRRCFRTRRERSFIAVPAAPENDMNVLAPTYSATSTTRNGRRQLKRAHN